MTQEGLEFRTPLDADELYELAKDAYKGSPWSKVTFEKDLQNRWVTYLVVLKADCPVGFVGGTLVADEVSISNVAIRRAYHGQGLGRALLLAWFDQFNSGTRFLLEVRASNQRAHALYEHLGFSIYNVREDYYHDPVEDAYLMDYYLP